MCSDVWEDPIKFKVFIFCIAFARFRESQISLGDDNYEIPIGSFLMSYKDVGEWCNVNKKTAERRLKDLAVSRNLSLKKTRHGMMITVEDYEHYQLRPKLKKAEVVPPSVPQNPDVDSPDLFLEEDSPVLPPPDSPVLF